MGILVLFKLRMYSRCSAYGLSLRSTVFMARNCEDIYIHRFSASGQIAERE